MAWTLCTSGSAIARAGANANSAITGYGSAEMATALDRFSDDVEGTICTKIHSDVVTNFSSYATLIQGALADAAASWIANRIIVYDMSGYTSRQEAGTMLDFNDDSANEAIKKLEQKNFQRFST